MRLVIISILLINTAFAQNSTYLKSGETAPFDGHLVKSEKMQELIKADKKVPLLEAKFETQNELIDYHKGNAREARLELSKSEIKGNVKGLYGFVIGVLAMSIAFKISKEIK